MLPTEMKLRAPTKSSCLYYLDGSSCSVQGRRFILNVTIVYKYHNPCPPPARPSAPPPKARTDPSKAVQPLLSSPCQRLHRVRRCVLPLVLQPSSRRNHLRRVADGPPPTVVARAHPVSQPEARHPVSNPDGRRRNRRIPGGKHRFPRRVAPQITPRLQLVGQRRLSREGRVLPREVYGRPGHFDGEGVQGLRGRARRGASGRTRDRGNAEA